MSLKVASLYIEQLLPCLLHIFRAESIPTENNNESVDNKTTTQQTPSLAAEPMDLGLPDPSEGSDRPVPQMKFSDEQYTNKLKQTIDSCKEKLDSKKVSYRCLKRDHFHLFAFSAQSCCSC